MNGICTVLCWSCAPASAAGGLDGKSFPVSEQQVGVNMHPMHPNCRCFISPEMTPEELKEITSETTLVRIAQTGADNWDFIPADMTWEEWRKKYVDGNPEMEAQEKMDRNRAKDREQWRDFKDTLGKDAPKNLADFQKMKYTEPEKWDELKKVHRGVKWQKEAQENGVVSGSVHKVPNTGTPNSVFDNYENGALTRRRYYGRTGKPKLDIDMTNHKNPKQHTIVPHYHGWSEDGVRDRRKDQKLTKAMEIANQDILKGVKRHGY